MAEKPTRTIVATTREGLVRIEGIPGDAKITFGAVQPGKYPAENALRIYTSNTNQLAVLVGVQEFRDESLTITRRVKQTSERSRSQKNSAGEQHSRDTSVDFKWVTDAAWPAASTDGAF